MGKNKNDIVSDKDEKLLKSKHKHDTDSNSDDSTDSESEQHVKTKKRSRDEKGKRKRRSRSYESEWESESESEEERRRRRKRRDRRKRREKEEERERKRRKKRKEEKKKKKKERGLKGAVTDSWGKYGIIRETDMWNKRPEFTAWLAEVKQINLESLPNWEEKQMFKEFMEDHNTATFPSKKYYGLDTYFKRKMEKDMKKGVRKVQQTERTVFNDEEQRRLELQRERERQKEEQVVALKRSMETGMAQAMKEQAQLREEMAYQYKLGNFEAAAAIQRRLDPDAAM